MSMQPPGGPPPNPPRFPYPQDPPPNPYPPTQPTPATQPDWEGGPPGYPPGPPEPPYGGEPPFGGPPPGPPQGPQHWKWIVPVVALALVMFILAVVAVVVIASSDDDGGTETVAASPPGEIFLENTADEGPDPFSASVAAATPPSTVAPNTPITILPGITAPTFVAGGTTPPAGTPISVKPLSGGTPGLYGGTGDQRVCNKEQMIDFLRNNPAKTAAWAKAAGIGTGEVSSFIDSLTPLLLRSDTRVTNNGFKNGEPTPRQSILRAGTAVLVDNRGVPRARCACGNPLSVPEPVRGTPKYNGPPWTGFNPGNITVINQSTTTINIITVINVVTGGPYGQPTGPGYPPPVTIPPLTTPTSPSSAPPGTQPPGTQPPGTQPPATGTSPPTSPACPGSPGQRLQRLTLDSKSSSTATSSSFPAGCGYRVVFSGEADWNVHNSFSGGFDSHYCYDPQYCAGNQLYKDGGGVFANGEYPWELFGTSPPPYSSSHTYSYTMTSIPGNFLSVAVRDVAHDDNQGTYFVDIFRN